MLFSICIPSYNRGHRAEALVKRLLALPYGKDRLEIVLSNNGSVKNTEGYDTLKSMQDERFHYFEFESNQQFVGNLNQVIKMSRGDFCMPLSDEDDIVPENLEEYMGLLEKFPNIGIVRSATSGMYADTENCYGAPGEEAINSFYMRGNYISGIIYNRKLITNALIDDYAARYKDNEGYRHYPHMFLDAYALTHSSFCGCNSILIIEGEEEGDLTLAENGNAAISFYGTYQNRLEQYQGFAEQIRDMQITDDLKLQLFLIASQKTYYLLNLIKTKYIQNGHDITEIGSEMSRTMKEELNITIPSMYIEERQLVSDFIDNITAQFVKE